MDSRTHVEFATQLLALIHADTDIAVVSLFPQIDRHPPTLHRMYAHTVFKAQAITQTGLHVLQDETWQDVQHAFEIRRFKEEKSRILSYREGKPWILPSLDSVNREAVLLAYISHLYLDTYNQPTQPFAPLSVYCSGQWKLWEQLGDFRLALYTTPIIHSLREDLFSHDLWEKAGSLSAVTLIQSMLVRMCQHSMGKIKEELVIPAMRSLDLEMLTIAEIASSCEFLIEFEQVLSSLHITHLAPNAVTSSAVLASPLALAA